MKKLISSVLSFAMMLSIACGLNLPVSAVQSGDYRYEVLSDGTAKITEYTGAADQVKIPSALDGYTVTVLGSTTFDNCSSRLTSVTIPDSVTRICSGAFTGCEKLSKVSIGSGVKQIDAHAFEYTLYNLKNVYYNGVKEQWNKINIEDDNEALYSAKMHFVNAKGPIKVGGKTILYKSGKRVTGTKVVAVAGKTYAIVKGYVKTGKTQTVAIKDKTYVISKNGVVQKAKSGKKIVKAGSKSYIVNNKGIVQKPAKSKYKLIKIGKKKYIVNKKGVIQKSRKSIKVDKKVYKTNKKGVASMKK